PATRATAEAAVDRDRSTMAETFARPDGRTHYEAVLDVRYGSRYSDLCARFYEHLDMLFGFVTLVGGTAAFTAFFQKDSALMAIAGFSLGAIAIIERLVCAPRKAERHCQAKDKFAALDA